MGLHYHSKYWYALRWEAFSRTIINAMSLRYYFSMTWRYNMAPIRIHTYSFRCVKENKRWAKYKTKTIALYIHRANTMMKLNSETQNETIRISLYIYAVTLLNCEIFYFVHIGVGCVGNGLAVGDLSDCIQATKPHIKYPGQLHITKLGLHCRCTVKQLPSRTDLAEGCYLPIDKTPASCIRNTGV